MARDLTTRDIHALINAIQAQTIGADASIKVMDTSTFTSACELVWQNSSADNILNALASVLNKTIVASRAYKGKFASINSLSTGGYSTRIRKISYYTRYALESGDYNTQLNTNFADGYDNNDNGGNSTKSQYEIHNPMVMNMFFGGSSVWQYCITVYEDQLKASFADEASFGSFVGGIMTEVANDIEIELENFRRLAVLNHMASVYDCSSVMKGSVVNLTKEFNDKFGTAYTSAQLRTTYLKEFLEFFISTFKTVSDRMTDKTTLYHWTVPKTVGNDTYVITRHTPKAMQKTLLYAPLFTDATAMVMPEIFNDDYLARPNGELVNFWQTPNDPSAIKVKPSIPDITHTNGNLQKDGAEVSIPYVVGMIYDNDALYVDMQHESSNSTSLECRKRFRNIWTSFRKNIISDITENTVLFVMIDED